MSRVSVWLHSLRPYTPTPVLLPGKSHGWRSLVGCSPWGREESDMTERLPFHFSLSCIGEGIGNPLQCSCLENPRDGEPGGLPSMGSHRVRHDWSDLAAAAAAAEKCSKILTICINATMCSALSSENCWICLSMKPTPRNWSSKCRKKPGPFQSS